MASNPVLDNIYSRKSIRAFLDRPVNDNDVKELIKAAFHAANGMNLQKLRFSVVTNKDKISEYSKSGKKLYLEMMKAAGIQNAQLEANLSNESFNIFYNAPAVIFVYAAPGILTGVEDASLAAGNIMLAANSMGLGTCWIGFAASLNADKGFLKDNNIPEGHKMLAAVILGYPKNTDMRPTPREEPQVLNWVR
ncbi:MAG: nitroreductase family protein [Methanomassiliicoccaceae archaeon]|jgi:nitroreductase|nr:nitroreductase family protein [Methanomassiliicoccaceae archaeon]